jgi:hypothetical protein
MDDDFDYGDEVVSAAVLAGKSTEAADATSPSV